MNATKQSNKVDESSLVLSLDTSSDYLSLAIGRGDDVIGKKHFLAARDHLAVLIPTIDELLKENGIGLSEIEVIAVGTGPGSFTGVRIGVATAQALAHGLKCRLIGISSLDVIAFGVWLDQEYKSYPLICPVVDAKKKEIYTNIYKNGESDSVSQVLFPEDLKAILSRYEENIIMVGDGLSTYKEVFISDAGPQIKLAPMEKWYPQAEYLIKLALGKRATGQYNNVKPIYVRLSDAEERLNRQEQSQK